MGRVKKGNKIDGWVILDKPYGMTSTQAVAKLRWLFQAQKAGHAGTLDPLATGCLPIAFGEATKTIPFAFDALKDYSFDVQWGSATTTDDAEGEVIHRGGRRPEKAEIEAALPAFEGEISQTPPIFSAIMVNGERAYDLARAGEQVELQPRTVYVEKLSLIQTLSESVDRFSVTCGKGTYVRALARDLAQKLGTHAHVVGLRREKVGFFGPQTMISLEKLEELSHNQPQMVDLFRQLLPVQTVLDDIPALAVNMQAASSLKNGQAIMARGADAPIDGQAYATCNGRLIAIGEINGGYFQPARVFDLADRP
jgi:tRNA pseudouridine55 synthase